jgi:hypothetical protein
MLIKILNMRFKKKSLVILVIVILIITLIITGCLSEVNEIKQAQEHFNKAGEISSDINVTKGRSEQYKIDDAKSEINKTLDILSQIETNNVYQRDQISNASKMGNGFLAMLDSLYYFLEGSEHYNTVLNQFNAWDYSATRTEIAEARYYFNEGYNKLDTAESIFATINPSDLSPDELEQFEDLKKDLILYNQYRDLLVYLDALNHMNTAAEAIEGKQYYIAIYELRDARDLLILLKNSPDEEFSVGATTLINEVDYTLNKLQYVTSGAE